MSLRTIVDNTFKAPSAIVKLNGRKIADVFSIDLSRSLNDSISSATLNLLNDPRVSPEARITIEQGYDNQHRLVFTGYIDTVDVSEEDFTYVLQARDVLKRAVDTYLIQEVAFGLDTDTGEYYYSTYSSIDGGTFTQHVYSSLSALNSAHPETVGNYSAEGVKAEAVVQWLLIMCGFSEGSEIQVNDTNFWIGDLKPATFSMTSVFDAIGQIAELIGWRLYADESGVVRFTKRPRSPSAYPHWTYRASSGSANTFTLKRSVTNVDLRNYVEVRGASGIVSIARSASEYIGNVPYRGVLISNELIDTQGIADFFASRVLNDLNRLKTTVVLEVDGNPFLSPGNTISLSASTANGYFLLEECSSQMSAEGYTSTLTLAQFLGDTFYEEPAADIVAAFSIINAAVVGDPKYMIQFDGAASYSSRGPIVEYEWTWPYGSTTSTESQTWHVFDSTEIINTEATISLTVRDGFGNVATTTSGITLSMIEDTYGEPKVRTLYAALSTLAAGSLDGGLTWNTSAIPAISCAASNFGPNAVYVASGYALFGTSSGDIYRTDDGCVSTVLVYDGESPITFLHIPEKESRYAVAGTEAGGVLTSSDSGVTWTLRYTFDFPIREVRYAYEDFTYMLVVGSGVGNTWHSFNSGSSWSQIGGALAVLDVNRESSGSSTNYYAHSSGIVGSLNGVPTHVSFSGGASPNIPALSIMVDNDDGIMAVDNTGQHWVYSGAQMSPTEFNPSNKTRYMIRDGEIPILTYYATESGVGKSLDRNETMQELYTNGNGRMVAYGPLTTPPTAGNILIFCNFTPTGAITFSGGPSTGPGTYLSTTSGWLAVAPLKGNLWSRGQFTSGPGYVIGHGDLNTVSLTLFDDTGSPTYYNAAHVSVSADPDDRVRVVKVSNRPGAKYVLMAPRYDSILNDPYILMFHNFFTTTPPSADLVYTNDWRANIYGPWSTRDLSFGEMRWPSLFAPGEYRRFDYDGTTLTSTLLWQGVGNDQLRIAPQLLVSGDDEVIFYMEDDGALSDGWYKTQSAGVAKPLPTLSASKWTYAAGNPDNGQYIFESVMIPGRIYFAENESIRYVDQYGDGDVGTLWTNPHVADGFTLWDYKVTYSANLSREYIALVVAQLSAPRQTFIYYSTDSGASWTRGPNVDRGLALPPFVAYMDFG